MFFGWFDAIFSFIFPILFLLFIGMFFFALISNLRTWNKNNHSPRLTVPATVVAKRTDVSHSSSANSIKASEKRLAEIAVLKAHIINYAKTRPVYDAYRKTGYSKRFLETHRTEITLHKAAKAAFDEANLKTLPKVKALDEEYSKLLTEKKARYPDYRKAKEEMQELLRAKKNVELFFAEEKSGVEKMKSR